MVDRRKYLVDWGIRTFVAPENTLSHRKMSVLLSSFRPCTILVSGMSGRDHRNEETVRLLIALVRRQARPLSILVKTISKLSIKAHFAKNGQLSKHEIAGVVVSAFPELGWHMPRKRKAWQSESSAQLIFDAVALIIVHLARTETSVVWSAPGDE